MLRQPCRRVGPVAEALTPTQTPEARFEGTLMGDSGAVPGFTSGSRLPLGGLGVNGSASPQAQPGRDGGDRGQRAASSKTSLDQKTPPCPSSPSRGEKPSGLLGLPSPSHTLGPLVYSF